MDILLPTDRLTLGNSQAWKVKYLIIFQRKGFQIERLNNFVELIE